VAATSFPRCFLLVTRVWHEMVIGCLKRSLSYFT